MQIVLTILWWSFLAAIVVWFIRRQMQKDALQKKEAAERKERERLKLIEVYGEEDGMLIFNKQIREGFTGQMVLYAWGNPDYKAGGVDKGKQMETWYYGEYETQRGTTKYRYKEGIVTGKQIGRAHV